MPAARGIGGGSSSRGIKSRSYYTTHSPNGSHSQTIFLIIRNQEPGPVLLNKPALATTSAFPLGLHPQQPQPCVIKKTQTVSPQPPAEGVPSGLNQTPKRPNRLLKDWRLFFLENTDFYFSIPLGLGLNSWLGWVCSFLPRGVAVVTHREAPPA